MSKKMMILFFFIGVFLVATGAIFSKYNFFILLEHNIKNERLKLERFIDENIEKNKIDINENLEIEKKIKRLINLNNKKTIEQLNIKIEKYNYEIEGYNSILSIFPNNHIRKLFGFELLNKLKVEI